MRTFLSILLLSFLVACRTGPAPADPATAPPSPTIEGAHDPAFDAFVDDFFEVYFAASPTTATGAGLHEYDGRLEDLSRGAIDRQIRDLRGLLRRVETMDRTAMSLDQRLDAQMIENSIRSSLLDLETLETWRNPMIYAYIPGSAIGSLIKRDFAPARDRLVSVIQRLEQIPAVHAAAKQNVTNPPKEFTDLAVRMAGGSAGYFEGTLTSWARQAAGNDAELLGRFERANAAVIASTRDFAQWLRDVVLPRSNGTYAIGAENFSKKLAYDEMVVDPLAAVLARGEAQLEKDYRAFVDLARRINPNLSAAEVLAEMEKEHPTAEDLIPAVRSTVEAARQYVIDHDIVTIPSEIRARIEETPPYARSGGFASMDTPGPFETKATEAFYYVTPVEESWSDEHKEEHLRLFNPWVVAMINVHEAYPGHYLQFLYVPQLPTKTRKLLYSGTNVEGWAHYTEQMMVDEGFGGNDPRYRLAQLQEALLRDVRYIVGIKLHTAGWTVEQGAKLFEEKAFQQPANAYEEARRGAYNPTYLYYTLGKLQIQQLRDEYMRAKGASLKEFHDAFVSQGGYPVSMIRQILFRN